MENNPARPRQPTTFASQNQTTPLNMRAASIHGSARINPCTTSHIYRGSRTVTMAREVEGHIVGPMALKDFVERFLPLSNGERGVSVNKTKLKRMKRDIPKLYECKREVDMYAPLIDAIKPLCPKFIPYDTHAKPLRNFDEMDVKPDICFYSKKHLAAKTMGISAVEMIAEVKYNINDDAFVCQDALNPLQDSQPAPPIPTTPIKPDEAMLTETTLVADDGDRDQQLVEETEEYGDDGDREGDDDDDDDDNQNRKPDPKQFESDIRSLSSQGRDTLGQITTYTVAQKAAQFRKHIFSLLIFKKYGRLLFWDWSGVVVTDRFPLTDDYFAEFFWRYNKATGSERGHDETIEVLNARERAAVSKLELFEKDARLVKIPVGQDDKQLFYVVEQPYFMGGLSPFGRSTRGFKAYSLQEILGSRKEKPEKPKKLFLKDTWRIIGRFYEHQFYDKLREANVKHIATYRQTSDVPNQETIVQQICEEASGALGSPKNIRRFHHYRMVFDQYASDLSTFRSTKELVSVFHQALQAHQEAYDAGVLHRDISVGNIMITEPDEPDEPDGLDGLGGLDGLDKKKNREALLVDWDMAKFTDDNTVGTMERTGTWQFMAARFLLDPEDTTPANFDDDLESFVYVLTWMVLRYTDVDYKPVQLYNTIRDIFIESHLNEEGQETGGLGKFGYLRGSGVLDKANIKNPHLRDLLSDIKDVIAVRFHNEQTVPSSSRFTRSNDVLEKKQFLETRKWMITFFEDALKAKTPPWPEDDAAKLNPMQAPAHDTTTLKRSTALRNLAADSDALERKSKRSRKA